MAAADARGDVGVVKPKLVCNGCIWWGAGNGERGPRVLKLRDEEKGDCNDCKNPCATGDWPNTVALLLIT